uniref:Tubulin, delta 1 n=1 Tax=Salmo trutta TaxID=8032 RepID=A0A674ENZ8_SALTR
MAISNYIEHPCNNTRQNRENYLLELIVGDIFLRLIQIDVEYTRHQCFRSGSVVTRRYDTLCFHFFAWRYCVHGPRHEEVVVDIVRREVERYDRVAGGTGSGVGTYATQCLRDAYPNSFILNHLTWPYGDCPELQLCSRCHTSDAILVHTVHNICTQLMNIKDISFSDINKVIAHQLGSVLQPALTGDFHGVYNRNPIGDGLVCHPEYKLLSFCNIPQVSSSSMAYSVFTWPGLLQHLHQMLTAFCMLLFNAIQLSFRGLQLLLHASKTKCMLFNRSLPALARPTSITTLDGSDLEYVDNCKYLGYKSPTLVSNSQALLRPLDNMGWKAWNMFASRLGTSCKNPFFKRLHSSDG